MLLFTWHNWHWLRLCLFPIKKKNGEYNESSWLAEKTYIKWILIWDKKSVDKIRSEQIKILLIIVMIWNAKSKENCVRFYIRHD